MRVTVKKAAKWLCILLCSVLAVVLAGCTGLPEDNPEAVEAAKALFEKTEHVNQLIWGEITPGESEFGALISGEGAYLPVREDFPYESVDAVKDAIGEVYSEGYCRTLFATLFDSEEEGQTAAATEDEVLGTLAPKYRYMDGALHINVNYTTFEMRSEVLPDTITVTDNSGYYVEITVDYAVNGEKAGTMTLLMLREEDGWRFDSPTY